MAINKDGSAPRANHKEMAEIYGSAAVRDISHLSTIHPDKWDFYIHCLIDINVNIAAHHGRISLRQSKLK